MSASSRMILDSLRTIIIWGFSLGIGWEQWCYIELIGFVFLISGTVIYQDVHPRLRIPGLAYPPPKEAEAGDDAAKLAATDSEDMQAGLLTNAESGKGIN
jgi:hypothetical protein